MHTKFGIAKKLAAQGITTHIASGKRQNTIVDLVGGKSVGTTVYSKSKVVSDKTAFSVFCGSFKRGCGGIPPAEPREFRSDIFKQTPKLSEAK